MYQFLYAQPLWRVCVCALLACFLWALLACLFEHRRFWRIGNAVLFVLYLAVIVYVTLLRRDAGTRVLELRLFQSIRNIRYQRELIRLDVMNVAVFIPLGLTLSALMTFKKTALNVLLPILVVCLISVSIEALQYVFACGTTELDDVIYNTLGGAFGALQLLLKPLCAQLLQLFRQ